MYGVLIDYFFVQYPGQYNDQMAMMMENQAAAGYGMNGRPQQPQQSNGSPPSAAGLEQNDGQMMDAQRSANQSFDRSTPSFGGIS